MCCDNRWFQLIHWLENCVVCFMHSRRICLSPGHSPFQLIADWMIAHRISTKSYSKRQNICVRLAGFNWVGVSSIVFRSFYFVVVIIVIVSAHRLLLFLLYSFESYLTLKFHNKWNEIGRMATITDFLMPFLRLRPDKQSDFATESIDQNENQEKSKWRQKKKHVTTDWVATLFMHSTDNETKHQQFRWMRERTLINVDKNRFRFQNICMIICNPSTIARQMKFSVWHFFMVSTTSIDRITKP